MKPIKHGSTFLRKYSFVILYSLTVQSYAATTTVTDNQTIPFNLNGDTLIIENEGSVSVSSSGHSSVPLSAVDLSNGLELQILDGGSLVYTAVNTDFGTWSGCCSIIADGVVPPSTISVKQDSALKITNAGDIIGILKFKSGFNASIVNTTPIMLGQDDYNTTTVITPISGESDIIHNESTGKIYGLSESGDGTLYGYSQQHPAFYGAAIYIRNSTLNGNIRNDGFIDGGIEYNSSLVHGDLINTGEISTQHNRPIGISGVTFSGNIINEASGNISTDGHWIAEISGTNFSGNIINRGLMEARGRNNYFDLDSSITSAIVFDSVNLSGNIENYGTIESHQEKAITFSRSAWPGSIINHGTISAYHDVIFNDGLRYYASDPDELNKNYRGTVINYGEISSLTADAIDFSRSSQSIEIHQNSGIIRGNILGGTNFDDRLIFSGGEIVGDISGIDMVELYSGSRLTGTINGFTTTTIEQGASVTGDLSFASGQTLETLLSNSTLAATPILTVNGNVTLADGSIIKISPTSQDFNTTRLGTDYTILETSGGNITANETTIDITTDSVLIDVSLTDISDNEVMVNVKSYDSGQIASQAGASVPQQIAVSLAQNAILANPNIADNDPVKQAFTNASTAEEIAELAAELLPDINGGAIAGATSAKGGAFTNVSTRMGSGVNTGDTFSVNGLWIQGLTVIADQDTRHGIEGYDADTNGFTLGFDGQITDSLMLGLAYSGANTDVDTKNSENSTDVESHSLTLYSTYNQSNYYVDAMLNIGRADNDAHRHIAGTVAKANYDTDILGLNVLAGTGYQVGQYSLRPQINLRYSLADVDSYTETGSTAALKVGSQKYESIELGAGASIARSYTVGKGILTPEFKAMAYHDFASDPSQLSYSFVVDPSAVTTSAQGATPPKQSYTATVSINYQASDVISFAAGYDYKTKSDFDASSFYARFRYDF